MPFSPKTGDKLISNVVKQDYTTHPSAVLLWTTWIKLSSSDTHNASPSRSGAQGVGFGGSRGLFVGCCVLRGVAALYIHYSYCLSSSRYFLLAIIIFITA